MLVTNFRSFVLVGRDAEGEIRSLDSYSLAPDAESFRRVALNPRQAAVDQGSRFEEYLKRVMLHPAPLVAPSDVASFLASYAREARARIEYADLDALATVRSALEDVLGLKFEGEKGDHFFRSSLVQTLFYGVFSAWVLWSKKPRRKGDRFRWHDTAWYLHVPMIRALFEQIATPAHLGELGVVETLDWSEDALNRVERAEFFKRFDEGRAVQYFYEPFLHAFDPELRKQLGVWFTPHEIVQYMVARIDTVLREVLQIEDGLADERVVVLDPCTGTGSYLVEVLRTIAATITQRDGAALAAHAVKRAAMERIFGFEILPAPFVVAHLQLGLLLQNLGAPLSEELDERAAVYLTNALTGWAPLDDDNERAYQARIKGMRELLDERDRSSAVKQSAPILVVVGNPPYNAFAGVSPAEEQGLVDVYKVGLVKRWGIKKFNLDDLYVRFFRMAERRITENTGRGIVCFISPFSYLSDPSFVTMRERFTLEFDRAWFDCMNGDSRETGKMTPSGEPDPSVFSVDGGQGIRAGTAIGLLVRKSTRESKIKVNFRHFWGRTKRVDLLASVDESRATSQYGPVTPDASNRFSFRPSSVGAGYSEWPSTYDLAERGASGKPIPKCWLGILENRADALVDVDRSTLEARMRRYLDKSVSWAELTAEGCRLTRDFARFDARSTRTVFLRSEPFDPTAIRRVLVRPMDVRWAYYSRVRPLWNEPRERYVDQCWPTNSSFVTRRSGVASPEGAPFFFTSATGMQHALMTDAYYTPVELRSSGSASDLQPAMLTHEHAPTVPNLSLQARSYLRAIGVNEDNNSSIWHHALAVGYSPRYLSENADGIRQDWPHIPLPAAAGALDASASLGSQVAALLDTELPVRGVTSGVREELRTIGTLVASQPGQMNLAIIAGWGHAGKGGVTMPGHGKIIEREYASDEIAAIEQGAAALGLSRELALGHLGTATRDIYLNDSTYWRNIPVRVWQYTIGGYQVIKKWLSYREQSLLGRSITAEEAAEVMNIARRIAALLLLEPALDNNYRDVIASTYRWPAAPEYLPT